MKSTRKHDLEILEIARDTTDSDAKKARRNAILESVYLQSKDPTLERIKNELAKWITYGLRYVPEGNLPPNKEQERAMAEAQINIERLEKAAQDYARSPAFQNTVLKKMVKHDPVKVDSVITKQKKEALI